MTRTRNVFKALGLSALVLGLMAIVAGSAQAEAGASWKVGGTDAGTLKAKTTITELLGGSATLLTKIAGAKVWFLTKTTPELVGVSLEGEGKLTTGGKVTFKGITTDLNEKASPVCTPLGTKASEDPKGLTSGTITSREGKGELVLHQLIEKKIVEEKVVEETVKEGVTQIKPVTGNVFATLFFGEECSLPAEVPVITKKETGKGLVLREPLGKLGTASLTHEITEVPALTELWAISETEEHKATIDGTGVVGLTTPHNAITWNGTPG